MSLALQDLIVTIVAMLAAAVLLHRIYRTLRADAAAPCGNCASGAAACARPTRALDEPQPLTLRTKHSEVRTHAPDARAHGVTLPTSAR